ncbi:hypothetical protein E5347_12115 [Clostridium sartagoforme]|uniref:Uncharacterized protein n=1 Tax=Clostridium sartagoforme TaxID=84031 RepID=A0A4S2DHA5_9CLOT|nr:hypothetical protein [Clostridium sartagoforme]TGY41469.1 hypothetical protein E5347_12115 [Clostridium sartagoforme]
MIEFLIDDNNIYILENGEKTPIEKKLIEYNYNYEIDNFISSIEEQKVSNIGIKDIYVYDEIEVYNFARGTICNNIKSILNKFLLIEALVKKYKGNKLKVYTNDLVYKYICKSMFNLICEDIKDNIENSKSESKFNKNKLKKIFRIIRGYRYLIKYKISKNKKENILFMTHASDINTIKIKDEVINYDCQFGELINSFKEEKNIFRMQFLNNDLVLDKSNKIGRDFFPFEDFIILKKTIFKMKFDNKKLKNNLSILKNFNFNFHNYNLYDLLNEMIFIKMEEILNSYIYEIYSAEKLIKFLKIDKIICTDEADRARCLIYSGNKLNKSTFAIQHGIITEASVSYFIPTENYIYIPKKTFVWGEEYRDKLLNGTRVYNFDNVVVSGQPRTDYLFKKINDGEKNNKSDNKVKILFATQYVKDLSKEATELLFSSLCKYNKEYEIVIKLHPNDTFIEMYHDLIKKYNIGNYNITKDMDIYEAIIWADVVISVHSTVNLEAAILNKPSICLLLSKYWDHGNFVKNNISKGAKNTEEVLELLYNINWEIDRDYIKRNFYKIDGLVGDRIKSVINSY